MTRLVLALATLAVATTIVGVALAADGTLSGSVGPGFAISLKDPSGNAVTSVAPGTYDIAVNDQSEEHDFHLTGPGVDVSTTVDEVAQKTFPVTLQDGTYTFFCDAHAATMRKTFTVGAGGGSGGGDGGGSGGGGGAGGGTPAPRPTAPVGSKLVLTTGPGPAISLRTTTGKKVVRLRPGSYTVLVRDRSAMHNARLRGAGVSKATTVRFVGTQTWKITLKQGKLTYQCDAHAATMHGTVTVA